MKSIVKIFMSAILITLFIVMGCDKKEEKVPNSIIISGNTFASFDLDGSFTVDPAGYYFGPTLQGGCAGQRYSTYIELKLADGVNMVIYLMNETSINEIPVGTYSIADFCDLGCSASIRIQTEKKAYYRLDFLSGTLTVAKEDDVYEVDFDLTFNSDAGGGTLTGNFSGTLQYATP